jgi:hypothetical protein
MRVEVAVVILLLLVWAGDCNHIQHIVSLTGPVSDGGIYVRHLLKICRLLATCSYL